MKNTNMQYEKPRIALNAYHRDAFKGNPMNDMWAHVWGNSCRVGEPMRQMLDYKPISHDLPCGNSQLQ